MTHNLFVIIISHLKLKIHQQIIPNKVSRNWVGFLRAPDTWTHHMCSCDVWIPGKVFGDAPHSSISFIHVRDLTARANFFLRPRAPSRIYQLALQVVYNFSRVCNLCMFCKYTMINIIEEMPSALMACGTLRAIELRF